jgi:hypothetical protein
LWAGKTKKEFVMKKKMLMSMVLLAIIGTSVVFAQYYPYGVEYHPRNNENGPPASRPVYVYYIETVGSAAGQPYKLHNPNDRTRNDFAMWEAVKKSGMYELKVGDRLETARGARIYLAENGGSTIYRLAVSSTLEVTSLSNNSMQIMLRAGTLH